MSRVGKKSGNHWVILTTVWFRCGSSRFRAVKSLHAGLTLAANVWQGVRESRNSGQEAGQNVYNHQETLVMTRRSYIAI